MHTQFLKQVDLFKSLPEHVLDIISSKVKTSTHKKHEFIFHEADKAQAVYFVKSGVVKLKKVNAQGKELIVCIKRAGNIFAEASLFSESDAHYPATAQMISDGEVLYLLTSDLQELIALNPDVSMEMIRFMSTQLRSFTETLRDIALLDVYGKTVKAIEKLARDFGNTIHGGVRIELPLSIQELASIVGSTRESVSRVLSKLKEQDLVSMDEKNIVVNNWCSFCQMFPDNHKE